MSDSLIPNGHVLIGRYVIEQYLTSGGMQEVYLCKDRALSRQVVVKTPKGGVSDRRFQRGAEMGARISHHNVAATFDYFEDERRTYLVEEFIGGSDLGKRLAADFYFLDPSLAAHVIHNIARALYEAHRVGICHRDLKPGNVMTSQDPGMRLIKLTDFGIAKLAESELAVEMQRFEQDQSTLTTSNTLLGAVPYMAPECWADWKGAGQPMDIWALGCIAYQLVTGETPFGVGRGAIAQVVRAEQSGKVELTHPIAFGKHVATAALEKDLWSLITSCIQVDPKSRPTAEDVLRSCGSWCYSTADRHMGVVKSYAVPYPSGVKGKSGYIEDLNIQQRLFFHLSEFFGGPPAVGQRVNFSLYPGYPYPRAAPVLRVR
ncbi:serine/threonine-protein kinase [Dyella humi]|uniref:non-specific serine/threonine protein kinase n=1 Tax=Dyella humi TaxID=1770547 RepID=A0ABW8IGS3_9GAMM